MGNVAMGQKAQQSKGQMTISDLTSKYQQKIDNYNLMIGLMNEEQKKIFQIAINLYDIQLRQDHWDSYVGYALNALARSGWYYNIMTQQWQVCQTPETFMPFDSDGDADGVLSGDRGDAALYPPVCGSHRALPEAAGNRR